MRAHCDARTEVLDARGNALIPGLVDSHLHPFWGAELARGTDLSRCRTPRRCSRRWRRARRSAAGCSPGGWTTTRRPRRGDRRRGATARRRSCGSPTCTPRSPRRARCELAQVTGPADFPDGSEVVCDGRRADGRVARGGRAGPRAARRAAAALAGAARPPRRGAAAPQRARADRRARDGRRARDARPAARPRGHRGADHAPARAAVDDAATRATRRSRRGSRCATCAGGCGAAAWPSSSPTA